MEGDSLPRSSADSQALKASKTLKRKTVDNLEVAAIIRWNLSSVARTAQDPLWHYAPCCGEWQFERAISLPSRRETNTKRNASCRILS